jgi:hypothetical protein
MHAQLQQAKKGLGWSACFYQWACFCLFLPVGFCLPSLLLPYPLLTPPGLLLYSAGDPAVWLREMHAQSTWVSPLQPSQDGGIKQ